MTIEAEDIVLDLVSRIVDHTDEPIVTRDVNKRANIPSFPIVFVVEGEDEVLKRFDRPTGTIADRQIPIATVSFIEASSGEAAAGELALFQQELIRRVYKDQRRRIGQYGGGIRELRASAKFFPKVGTFAIAQAIFWQAFYKEDSARLFT